MIEALFLLLPVAAASGWWLARRDAKSKADGMGSTHPDFLRGLNYLLDEQPDKAIDMFLRLTEVDGETVETHLALGSLFRRRGEVDRAIRIHQNLMERPHLSPELRGLALFELGQDYMRAGLLDRAEGLFQELVALGLHVRRALQSLREVYQQERDWVRCLDVAERLKPFDEQSMAVEIAQYHCELAEEARRKGDATTARKHLAQARQAEPNCVRAAMLEGFMALEEGDAAQAIALFRQVADRGGAYVPEILPALVAALGSAGEEAVVDQLTDLAKGYASSSLMLSLSEHVERLRGTEAALEILSDYLTGHADLVVLERFLLLQTIVSEPPSQTQRHAHIALGVVRHLLLRQPVYQCEQCGFQARSLHWQCPSCKCWGSVVSVLPEPIAGESPKHPT